MVQDLSCPTGTRLKELYCITQHNLNAFIKAIRNYYYINTTILPYFHFAPPQKYPACPPLLHTFNPYSLQDKLFLYANLQTLLHFTRNPQSCWSFTLITIASKYSNLTYSVLQGTKYHMFPPKTATMGFTKLREDVICNTIY